MQFSRLVLPAPFGPMMAERAPASTEKLTSWRAVTPPKRRTRCEMSRRGEDIRLKTTCLLYRGEPDGRRGSPPAPAPALQPQIPGPKRESASPLSRARALFAFQDLYFFSSDGVGVAGGVAPSL